MKIVIIIFNNIINMIILISLLSPQIIVMNKE